MSDKLTLSSQDAHIIGGTTVTAGLKTAQHVVGLLTPRFGNCTGTLIDKNVVKFQGQAPTGYVPVNVLKNSNYLAPSAFTLLAGYGLDDGTTQTGSGILRETFTVLSNPRHSQTEAVLDQTIGRGTCSGDSGGPAFLLLNGAYYIWGITSRGDAQCKKTGVYTVVVPYQLFIDTAIRQLQASF